MRYIFLFILTAIICFTSNNDLCAQRKRKIKPVYHGKLQGGYQVDKFIPRGYAGFTYLNLGIRKVTGEKIRETGIETFYYNEIHDREEINQGYVIGNEQTGFGLNFYHYIKLKKWDFGKLNIQTGPQFSFGYYHNDNLPLSSNNFPRTFNDFKLGATARVELNYKIDERYSFLIGAQYTVLQAGLRRINNQNPILTRRQQLEDFLELDFLVDKYTAYVGILRQFGKVKINREKIKRKKAAEKERKQKKKAKKQAKKEKRKNKQKLKKAKKKAKKKKS